MSNLLTLIYDSYKKYNSKIRCIKSLPANIINVSSCSLYAFYVRLFSYSKSVNHVTRILFKFHVRSQSPIRIINNTRRVISDKQLNSTE